MCLVAMTFLPLVAQEQMRGERVASPGAQVVSVGGLFVTAPYQATGPGRGGRLRLEWVDPPEFRVEENAAIC